MTTLKKLWAILTREDKRQAIFLLLLILIGAVFESIGLGMVFPLIGLMTAPEVILAHSAAQPVLKLLGNPDPETAFFIILATFVGVYVFVAIYRLWLSWHQTAFLVQLQMSTAARLYEFYLHQPWPFHLKSHSAELIQNITKEIDLLTQYGFTGALNLIRDTILIAVVTLVFISVAPLATAAVVAFLAPLVWGFQWLSKLRVRRWAKSRQDEDTRRLKSLHEGLGAVKELQLLGCEDLFHRKFREHSDNLARITRLQSFMRGLARPIFEISAIVCLTIAIIAMWATSKELSAMAPILGLFAVAIVRLMPSLNAILTSVHGIRYVAPSVNVIFGELHELRPWNKTETGPVLPFRSEIELGDITFEYGESAEPMLRGINFQISRGSFTAIVGKSGAGKSTLIDIILGLLEPTRGSVKVDGENIQKAVRGWQRQIGYVGQNVVLIDDTLRRNIALGIADDEIDDTAIWLAIEATQLTDFASGTPQKLDTVVGERGTRLSGGERQRIGIARALYANASVLILDEITSSLDEQTEASIIRHIQRLKGDTTIIMVTHRMATIGGCDQVVRLDQGRVVEIFQPNERGLGVGKKSALMAD